jgi:hypothetical protein
MADTCHLTKLLEWKTVDFRAEIEAQIRNPFLFLAGLRVSVALLFYGCEDGFRIHACL